MMSIEGYRPLLHSYGCSILIIDQPPADNRPPVVFLDVFFSMRLDYPIIPFKPILAPLSISGHRIYLRSRTRKSNCVRNIYRKTLFEFI